jgi:hypothetical protein
VKYSAADTETIPNATIALSEVQVKDGVEAYTHYKITAPGKEPVEDDIQ